MTRFVSAFSLLVLMGAGCTWSQSTDVTVQEEPSTGSSQRSVSGTITSVNLDGIAADGPAVITVQTESGVEVIHVPSFGLNLCAANESITDVYVLKSGDRVEARGTVSEEGAIVPCDSEEHYLRVSQE